MDEYDCPPPQPLGLAQSPPGRPPHPRQHQLDLQTRLHDQQHHQPAAAPTPAPTSTPAAPPAAATTSTSITSTSTPSTPAPAPAPTTMVDYVCGSDVIPGLGPTPTAVPCAPAPTSSTAATSAGSPETALLADVRLVRGVLGLVLWRKWGQGSKLRAQHSLSQRLHHQPPIHQEQQCNFRVFINRQMVILQVSKVSFALRRRS